MDWNDMQRRTSLLLEAVCVPHLLIITNRAAFTQIRISFKRRNNCKTFIMASTRRHSVCDFFQPGAVRGGVRRLRSAVFLLRFRE